MKPIAPSYSSLILGSALLAYSDCPSKAARLPPAKNEYISFFAIVTNFSALLASGVICNGITLNFTLGSLEIIVLPEFPTPFNSFSISRMASLNFSLSSFAVPNFEKKYSTTLSLFDDGITSIIEEGIQAFS